MSYKQMRIIVAVAVGIIAGLGLLGSNLAKAAPAVQRPIADFVDAQGTFCIDDGMGGCVLFFPPFPNYLGWVNPDFSLFALVDYAGLVSPDAEVTGSITEEPLKDGRARVNMEIHTTNARIFVTDLATGFPGTVVFGNFTEDVEGGAPASVAQTFFHITFINTAPGAPIPDLIKLFNEPEEGQKITFAQFIAQSDGLLADGTRGRALVVQIGAPGRGATVASPADKILVRSVGDGK